MTACEVAYSREEGQDDTEALKQVVDRLIESDPDIHKKSWAVLSRYNFDIQRIRSALGFSVRSGEDGGASISFRRPTGDGTWRNFLLPFLTVHKAKGLEFDIVVVLNCNSGRYGFPAEMSDDPVLNVLLSGADQYDNGEERRLFYVAMTRARERVVFIADEYFKSKFICELDPSGGNPEARKCPYCKTGDLKRKIGTSKKGHPWWIVYCSNGKRYGCEYEELSWKQTPSKQAKRTCDSRTTPKSGCFIATVCYGSPNAREVRLLREYRDEALVHSEIGRLAVGAYYRLAPRVASVLGRNPAAALLVRAIVLSPVIRFLEKRRRSSYGR
jgi:DNA helicase-4